MYVDRVAAVHVVCSVALALHLQGRNERQLFSSNVPYCVLGSSVFLRFQRWTVNKSGMPVVSGKLSVFAMFLPPVLGWQAYTSMQRFYTGCRDANSYSHLVHCMRGTYMWDLPKYWLECETFMKMFKLKYTYNNSHISCPSSKFSHVASLQPFPCSHPTQIDGYFVIIFMYVGMYVSTYS